VEFLQRQEKENKTGGITRAKNHHLGVRGEVKPCMKIAADAKLFLKENYDKKNNQLMMCVCPEINVK